MSDEDLEKQTGRIAALLTEHFDDQLSKLVEVLDSRIDHRIRPLQTSMESMQADMKMVKIALKDTNADMKTNMQLTQSLDKALGNVEHRVDNLTTLVTDHYLGGVWRDRELLHELDERVGHLEKATA